MRLIADEYVNVANEICIAKRCLRIVGKCEALKAYPDSARICEVMLWKGVCSLTCVHCIEIFTHRIYLDAVKLRCR